MVKLGGARYCAFARARELGKVPTSTYLMRRHPYAGTLERPLRDSIFRRPLFQFRRSEIIEHAKDISVEVLCFELV